MHYLSIYPPKLRHLQWLRLFTFVYDDLFLCQSSFHDGKHIFVAQAYHSHQRSLHEGEAGDKDKRGEHIVMPGGKMVYGQIDNKRNGGYQLDFRCYHSRRVGFAQLEKFDAGYMDAALENAENCNDDGKQRYGIAP